MTNFLVNLVAGVISYPHQLKKPSLRISDAGHHLLSQLALPAPA